MEFLYIEKLIIYNLFLNIYIKYMKYLQEKTFFL